MTISGAFRPVLSVLLVSCALCVSAQRIRLSGTIRDARNSLSNVVVFSPALQSGTASDSSGNFSLLLPKGKNEISVSYVGYTTQVVSLNLRKDTSVEIVLTADDLLKEAVVTETKIEKQARHEADGFLSISKDNFNSIPAFLGEHDPMRAVQLQAGVQSGSEGGRGIFVRGGSPDQNLMLLDGATVYNPSHIYGFISVFNGDAVGKVDIYKDRLPARYGGRLCSALDIEMNEGNREKIRGSLSLGLITSRININGPLSKNKRTTFSLSLRGCYMGLYTGFISKKQYAASGYSGRVLYYFGDVNAKIVHRFSEKTKIALSFFTNNDYYSFIRRASETSETAVFNNATTTNLRWANYVAAVNLTHRFSDAWNMAQHLTFSRYELRSESDYATGAKSLIIPANQYLYTAYNERLSYINNFNFSNDFSYKTGHQQFNFGAGAGGLYFQTGKGKSKYEQTGYATQSADHPIPVIKAAEVFLYVEDEIHPVKRFTMSVGFHARTYTQGATFASLLPRFNFTYNPFRRFFFRGAVSGTFQPMHLLTSTSADVLSDLWVPATKKAAPETGWNFSGGILHKLPFGFEWSLDAFYRLMKNVIDYKEGVLAGSNTEKWQDQIAVKGTGRSYGLEAYAGRMLGRVTGSVAYTLSWSERKFAGINNGEYYPYKYDRRHNLAAQLSVKVGKHVELGAAYVYGTGYRYTLPLQNYYTWNGNTDYDYFLQKGIATARAENLPSYTTRNGYTLPSYQHLDISFTWRKRKRILEHEVNVSFYNVYSHFNQFAVYSELHYNPDGSSTRVLKQVSLFPVLPSITYTIYLI